MRITQIQLMRDSILHTTLRPVALALAAGLALAPSLALAAAPAPATISTATPIAGAARVIDGDTIVIGETHIRLEGIDAPESAQTCHRRWLGTWNCGADSAAALRRLTAGKTTTCDPKGVDKYGRTLAICFVDRTDINAAMVRQGYAWAFVKYSSLYVQEEAAAKADKVGIWQGDAQPAWDFRAHRWSAAEQQAPEGCAIKGNVTRNGRIYHMPWSPWYNRIRIEPEKGKRWFCSEAEAVAAGWRPAHINGKGEL